MTTATIRKIPQSELSEQQLAAAAMLASGKTGKATAEALDVSEGTVSRWRQQPAFEAAVNRVLTDAHDAARDRMRSLVTAAMDIIAGAMDDPDVPAKDRLSAAFKVLDLCGVGDLAREPVGPVDPETVEAERHIAAMAEKNQRAQREFNAEHGIGV